MSNSTRPSSSSSYDERFVVPLEASRRGAHRARVSPLMAVLPVAAVVGIVVGAIALVYVFLGGGSEGSGSTTTAATPSAPPSASATSSPAEGSAAEATSSTTATPGSVDKSIPLDVFNATGTSGLAKKAGTKLTSAGWSTGRIETWTGGSVTQTTVYYATADDKTTAQAVVKTLGRGIVKLSPSRAGEGMAVVIGPDYPGATSRAASTTQRPDSTRSSTKTLNGTTTSPEGSAASPTRQNAQSSRTTGEATTSATN